MLISLNAIVCFIIVQVQLLFVLSSFPLVFIKIPALSLSHSSYPWNLGPHRYLLYLYVFSWRLKQALENFQMLLSDTVSKAQLFLPSLTHSVGKKSLWSFTETPVGRCTARQYAHPLPAPGGNVYSVTYLAGPQFHDISGDHTHCNKFDTKFYLGNSQISAAQNPIYSSRPNPASSSENTALVLLVRTLMDCSFT